jgi:hypothetical protein
LLFPAQLKLKLTCVKWLGSKSLKPCKLTEQNPTAKKLILGNFCMDDAAVKQNGNVSLIALVGILKNKSL